jgi:hypothetical protein
MTLVAIAPQRQTTGKNAPDDDRSYEPYPWTTKGNRLTAERLFDDAQDEWNQEIRSCLSANS